VRFGPEAEEIRHDTAGTQLIDDLFDRLSKLEGSPRDADAEAAIISGLRRAPNAALCVGADGAGAGRGAQRANARIGELEEAMALGNSSPAVSSFHAPMRFRTGPARPRLGAQRSRADAGSRPAWNTGQALRPAMARRPAKADRDMASLWRKQPPPVPGGGGGGRSSARPLRLPPAWSAARCCSPASGA